MYLSVKQIEVVNENNIECKIQMPSHWGYSKDWIYSRQYDRSIKYNKRI
jgi:hypothetical protein